MGDQVFLPALIIVFLLGIRYIQKADSLDKGITSPTFNIRITQILGEQGEIIQSMPFAILAKAIFIQQFKETLTPGFAVFRMEQIRCSVTMLVQMSVDIFPGNGPDIELTALDNGHPLSEIQTNPVPVKNIAIGKDGNRFNFHGAAGRPENKISPAGNGYSIRRGQFNLGFNLINLFI